MPGGRNSSFGALRRLAHSFAEQRSVRQERELRELACQLGPIAIPLCLRELMSAEAERRRWAARMLEAIAGAHRDRVVAELHAVAAARGEPTRGATDDVKVTALTLLGDLGERVHAATFRDPAAIHRRSLGQLAELLTCAPDVALAADLLVTQLDADALLDFVDGLAQTAPARTRHLVDELLIRTDLDPGLRAELRRVAAPLALVDVEPLAETPRRRPRVMALRHPGGRTVVIAGRRDADGGWRCLCVLIDADGWLADGLYRDDAAPRAVHDELVQPLLDDGFAPDPIRAAAVRARVADAARRTVTAGRELPSAYYLGRDLLDLGDAHQSTPWQPDLPTTLLGRAVDLLAAGEAERARPLLEHCVSLVPGDADASSSYGLCLLACGDLDGARAHLERAVKLEPTWPTHHWNVAAIAHRQGRTAACYLALRRFVSVASHAASAADPAQLARLELAARFVADHERMIRLEHPGADAVGLAEATETPHLRPRSRRPRKRPTLASARPRRSAPPPSPARP